MTGKTKKQGAPAASERSMRKADMPADGPVRLQKFLSMAGVCSRRTGETYIQAGRVRVNGQVVTTLGTKVNPATDSVTVDGRKVRLVSSHRYVMLNKPVDYVTSCNQPGERIVLDLVDVPERLYPVGRLDKDSTGLLLLTNDGRLHHRLSHPSFDHEKEYVVTVAQAIPDDALNRMAKGVTLDGRATRPAAIHRLGPRRFRMVLQEGRNRQIRRMAEAVGHRVVRLKRVRMGPIRLGRLAEGCWRLLGEREVSELLEAAGL